MFDRMVVSSNAPPILLQATNTQSELIAEARKGDGSAFTILVRDLHSPLCTYLARLVGDDELGRDLAQETLIHAWSSLPGLREEQHFKAWVYRIATNLARSHLRRARLIRWLPWTEASEKSAERALQVEGPEERMGETEIVKKTLAQLSPRYRTCLLLQIVGGFAQRDIALMLGISEKSVGSNVCRAREQFRQIYQRVKGDTE
ncbi:MAG TPA: RNA polymerase sigma factor [Ktedonobacteraceae bacterium]|nr:RNA polymerase sigma factor [Ktedonobacteraceae bacterium]